MMDKETAKSLLENKGFKLIEEKRLSNDTGWQLKLKTGQVVNIYDKGTWNVQGKDQDSVNDVLREYEGPRIPESKTGISRKCFVVYGHDTNARNELEAMLRRWNIEPLILDQLPSEGMTLIEKLEKYRGQVNFGVVLATPDDEGHRAGQPSEKAFRARQNVVLELGMLLAILGRSKVAILIKNPDTMERPSDVQGLIFIPFKDRVEEVSLSLAKEMNAQGVSIDLGRL